MKEFNTILNLQVLEGASDSYAFYADPFQFEPTATVEEGGIAYDCSQTFVIDRPDDDVLRFFFIPKSCKLQLSASDGSKYIIGTDDIPAQVHIIGHLYKCRLVMECKMTTNPLL